LLRSKSFLDEKGEAERDVFIFFDFFAKNQKRVFLD
jgi:hypothetical protein